MISALLFLLLVFGVAGFIFGLMGRLWWGGLCVLGLFADVIALLAVSISLKP